MKLKHQLKDQNVEREVSDDHQLGFFISNKTGGMLFFDAKKDSTQYFSRFGDKTYKIIHDLNMEGKITGINNKLHTFEVTRNKNQHHIFAPFYINAISIISKQEDPIQIVFEPKDLVTGAVLDKHTVTEKQGRVLIKSSNNSGSSSIYSVVQGNDLKYDHNVKKGESKLYLDILSPRAVIAMSLDEQEALAHAEHVFQNEQKIKDIQDDYMSTSAIFKDSEVSMAYACVLNSTDNMFLDNRAESDQMQPVPHFSEVTPIHTAIATQALLTEGEFGIVKKSLLAQIEKQQDDLSQGTVSTVSFEEAAWPVFLFGKMLNKMCSDGKLYSYFNKEEVQSLADRILQLTHLLESRYFPAGETNTDSIMKLESQALMLSIYNLAYALTKSDEIANTEQIMKAKVFNNHLYSMLNSIKDRGFLTQEDMSSLLLTSYVYPFLLGEEEWKHLWDTTFDLTQRNFKTLRKKIISEKPSGPVNLELFGMTSLAAIVLNRLDSEYYEKDINSFLRSAVSDVLYKGVIGRPTSSYDEGADPENRAFIQNIHLLNNALFLEMLKDCA